MPRSGVRSGVRFTSTYPQSIDEMPPVRRVDSPGQPMALRPGRLIQAHITCRARQSVLLGKWKAGPFAGRVSGMIGLTKEGESPEQAAARLSMTLAGLEIAPATYERRGLFGFVETDAAADTAASYGTAYEEMQLVCDREADCGLEPVETELFTPLGWVPFVAVPYDQMPADDAIWYPKLLPVAGASFGGRFWFDGEQLVKHALWKMHDGSLYRLTADQDPGTAGNPALQASL